jgi:hypothetical protein
MMAMPLIFIGHLTIPVGYSEVPETWDGATFLRAAGMAWKISAIGSDYF